MSERSNWLGGILTPSGVHNAIVIVVVIIIVVAVPFWDLRNFKFFEIFEFLKMLIFEIFELFEIFKIFEFRISKFFPQPSVEGSSKLPSLSEWAF